MVNDPRPPKPRPSGPQPPQDPLDLLRELAGDRAPAPHAQPRTGQPQPPDEKLEELRALAKTLDRQLRATASPESFAEPSQAPPPQGELPQGQWPQDQYQGQHQDPYQDPRPPQPTAPRAKSAAWRDAAQAEWAAFYAGLPPARDLVPRIRVPEIAFAAIAAGVLVASAVATFILHHRPARLPGSNELVVPGAPSPVPAPSAPPAAQEPRMPTVADVKQAMSECDAAAAQDADALYFLVLPLLRADPGDAAWNPVPLQTIGSSYVLLGASDALDGLGSGKLKVRDGRYTFAVLDPQKGTTWSWTSATRMSRLARKDPTGVKTLKLGFDFSPTQSGPQWSAEFKRDRGTCYWVSVLVR